MKTNLKVILAAISIAVLASPVMAESGMLTISSDSWQRAAGQSQHAAPPANIANARGSVAGARTVRTKRAAPVVQENQFHIDDAVHVAFPQQSNGN